MRFEPVTIRTDRLVLRPYRLEDAPRLHALIDNWNIARMLTRVPHPYPAELAASWIATHDAERAAGQSHFAMEADGELVGATGLHVEDTGDIETGYWIGEPYWGKGYATEGARAMLEYGFAQLRLEQITAGHFVDNPASGRVLTKCGFRYTGTGQRFSLARDALVDCREMIVRRQDIGF